ncbi:hypothetical protein chiPu_0026172 [Chiloscyllium punctatum]|uniref:Uncharacterized protein n=1 Tax=Chiloscyllium punctatum TaxID=137246 RepID=A0A401THI5_CHIPU|nr:hypothetical protein [Chiloscyllium punctatum]
MEERMQVSLWAPRPKRSETARSQTPASHHCQPLWGNILRSKPTVNRQTQRGLSDFLPCGFCRHNHGNQRKVRHRRGQQRGTTRQLREHSRVCERAARLTTDQ